MLCKEGWFRCFHIAHSVCDDNQTLEGYKLTGKRSPEIAGLQHLQVILLGSNFLYGLLPFELGNIQDLYFFVVDYNKFTGTHPSETRHLKALIKFSAARNPFLVLSLLWL
jgi:hypothetical protein